MSKRFFEKVSRIKENIKLPERSTKYSAGYDFFALEDIIIPPYKIGDSPILVLTGIKAKFPNNEFLMIVNRSSNPRKKNLVISNGVGIVDSDYYNNMDNEGEIGILFYNISSHSVEIKKGEKICQGIFQKYYLTNCDKSNKIRLGGFGSTN